MSSSLWRGRGAWWPLLLAVAMLGPGCASAPPSRPVAALAQELRDARFVLLGEVHDNPEHHRQRAQLLRLLLADGRPTRVVFEQMDRQSDAAIAAAARDPEAVADAGRLDRAGWRWPLHRPLVEAALAGGATVSGGNFDREFARRLVREGLDAAPADLRQALETAPWSAAQDAVLREAIVDGHCGMMPADRVGPMVLVQRGRDASLAQAMLRGGPPRVVLIAGNGHVRSDVGVPHYLRAAGVPAADIKVVGFVETGSAEDPPFDLRQVTRPVDRPDPCANLREPPASGAATGARSR